MFLSCHYGAGAFICLQVVNNTIIWPKRDSHVTHLPPLWNSFHTSCWTCSLCEQRLLNGQWFKVPFLSVLGDVVSTVRTHPLCQQQNTVLSVLLFVHVEPAPVPLGHVRITVAVFSADAHGETPMFLLSLRNCLVTYFCVLTCSDKHEWKQPPPLNSLRGTMCFKSLPGPAQLNVVVARLKLTR